MIRDELIPSEQQIFAWIEEVFSHGVRRPGYPADRWAESWLQDRFRDLGLDAVRAEPVELPYWEPLRASLVVTGASGRARSAVFPATAYRHARRRRSRSRRLRSARAGSRPWRRRAVRRAALRVPQTIMAGLATWPYRPGRNVRDVDAHPAVRARVPGRHGAVDRGGRRRLRRRRSAATRATRATTTCRTTRSIVRIPASGSAAATARACASCSQRGPASAHLTRSMRCARPSRRTTSSANCRAPTTRPSSSARTTTARGPRPSRTAPASRSCWRRPRTGRACRERSGRTGSCSCSTPAT